MMARQELLTQLKRALLYVEVDVMKVLALDRRCLEEDTETSAILDAVVASTNDHAIQIIQLLEQIERDSADVY